MVVNVRHHRFIVRLCIHVAQSITHFDFLIKSDVIKRIKLAYEAADEGGCPRSAGDPYPDMIVKTAASFLVDRSALQSLVFERCCGVSVGVISVRYFKKTSEISKECLDVFAVSCFALTLPLKHSAKAASQRMEKLLGCVFVYLCVCLCEMISQCKRTNHECVLTCDVTN